MYNALMRIKNSLLLLFICSLTYIIVYKTSNKNNQCLKNTGVWVGYETLLPIEFFNQSILYKDFNNLYLKSDLDKLVFTGKSCGNGYDWFEDGLSLNYLTNETRHLVFENKVDGKYWLDISKPESRFYILNKFRIYRIKYPNRTVHLDDHWAIPNDYGDYGNYLNILTKDVSSVIGPISLSVLPLNYSIRHYNANWKLWLDTGYLNEIILQNYVDKNFDYELLEFKHNTKNYKGLIGVGVYIRQSDSKESLEIKKRRIISFKMVPIEFSLRTSLLLDLKTKIGNN
jgi:hypothetical protein